MALRKQEFNKLKTRDRVEALVKDYANVFKGEYAQFVLETKANKEQALNEFAGAKDSGVIERKLHEIPATLFSIFQQQLEPAEFNWVFDTIEGSRWFAQKFYEFRSGEKV